MDLSYHAHEYWKHYPYLNPEPDFGVIKLYVGFQVFGRGFADHRVDTN